MAQVTVRDYRPEDRDAVRRICFETGMQGSSIAPQYRDFESFADIFTAYYTDHEAHNALVCELDGQVVGYTLGALDTRKAHGPLRYMLKHALLRGACFRPGTARFYWRCFVDSLTDIFSKEKRPALDLDKYPSHPHINLLASARASGAATEMFYHLFDRLKQQGSRGIFGEVLASNKAVQAWSYKIGFRKLGEPFPIPGLRDAEGKRVKLQIVARELESWEVGAWKTQEVVTAATP
jgi:hypothetical protein